MSERVRPAVSVSNGAVVVETGQLDDRRAFVALIGELSRACDEAFPVVESLNWRSDPHRSDDSGTIGSTRASGRKRESR